MKKSMKTANTGIKATKSKAKALKIAKLAYIQIAILMSTVIFPTGVFATPPPDPSAAKWNTIINFILPWIGRLGGVVILIGGVEFGLAWKNDDAEKKTQGMRTIIAGCIVTAVGLSSSLFLS
ncbi:MAG: hypothetical protein RSA79_00960 [Oscillospiraceae bacterium]